MDATNEVLNIVYVIHYHDSKFREEGIIRGYFDEQLAENEASRLGLNDEYGYIYYVRELEIK